MQTKHKLLLFYVILLFIGKSNVVCAQFTQIGLDIDGEAINDISGSSVSISANGLTVAIGAPWNNGNGSNSGHVRIYKLVAGVWTQQGGDVDGEVALDESGNSVSLSADGLTVAIGSKKNDGNGTDAGHVRVYKLISGVWTQQGMDIDGEGANDESGFSVSLSADGLTVAIGAPYNDGNGTDAGHVRVYKLIAGTWTQQGIDIDGEAANDRSGYSVSLSDDGLSVAIGAKFNDGGGSNAGHTRVYKFIGGVWMQQGGDIDGELANDRAGWSVSLNSDGLVVAVGAPLNDGNGSKSGHVRVYKLISGIWIQQGLDIDGEATLDESGGTVSLSNDGLTVAIGAKKNDGNGSNSGHVRVYSMFADLPISLVNFDATAKNNNYIQLTWQTASEINNDYFTIEKSKDGLNWVFVNEQPGAGNNNTLLNYTAIDNNPYQGVSYYRLKQTDFNGDYSYSAIRAVSIATNNTISIYPNPTSDNFILSINGNNEEITMEIYNSIGQQVMIKKFTTKDTPLNKKITTNQLPNGVYYVSIKTGKIIETQKLIISK